MEKLSLQGHTELIQSMEWNYTGQLLATSAKDKKIKVWDPRTNAQVSEGAGHPGVKGSRITWLGNKERLFSVGFSKTSQRQYCIWDPRNMENPLAAENIDTSAGIIMPFYDNDTGVLFLAGKGDGNIRYYEIVDEAPYLYFLSEYKSSTPQRGMGMKTKRAVDVSTCEIACFMKLTTDMVEPLSMQVPRKVQSFQDDLFPDTPGPVPGCDADAWFGGANPAYNLISLRDGFVAAAVVTNFAEQASADTARPQGEKALSDALVEAEKRIKELEDAVAQRDVTIRRLEVQLAEAAKPSA